MNGNVTKEGITKDLEWMKRVEIGGFQNFDTSLFDVPGKIIRLNERIKAYAQQTKLVYLDYHSSLVDEQKE